MKKLLLLATGLVMSVAASAQLSLSEGWNYSAGTTVPEFLQEDGTNLFRNMAYNNGKVYVLYSAGSAKNHIKILDAYNGEYKGELSLDGISTGYFYVSGITAMGGKIFACNCLTSATGTFKIYSWDNDESTPTEVLSDATIASSIGLLGAQLNSYGDLTNGKLIVNNNTTTQIAYYNVKNGVVETTPTVVSLKDADDKTWAGDGSRGSSSVTFNEDGTFWVDGKGQLPTLFSAEGVAQKTVKSGALNGNSYGSDIDFITYKNKKYAVAATYYTSARNGAFTVFDVTDGVENATSYEALCPSAGLYKDATKNNSAFITSVECATRNNGEILDIWYLSNEGVVFYTTDTATAIESVAVDANAPVEYYNLQGVKVANPENGLFIKKQGNKATKVIL